jgi:predicted GTPase
MSIFDMTFSFCVPFGQMQNGKEFLLTDTVGFIQKLPTTLVAAFRATLEEIAESSLLVHVVDIRFGILVNLGQSIICHNFTS